MEEQQNNNLSVEILNGNAESLTGLVGSAQALKEPGIDRLLAAGGGGNPARLVHTTINARVSSCLFQTSPGPRAREDGSQVRLL